MTDGDGGGRRATVTRRQGDVVAVTVDVCDRSSPQSRGPESPLGANVGPGRGGRRTLSRRPPRRGALVPDGGGMGVY